jgi:hypothetical protein
MNIIILVLVTLLFMSLCGILYVLEDISKTLRELKDVSIAMSNQADRTFRFRG